MRYMVSDIHGCYDQYRALLKKIMEAGTVDHEINEVKGRLSPIVFGAGNRLSVILLNRGGHA